MFVMEFTNYIHAAYELKNYLRDITKFLEINDWRNEGMKSVWWNLAKVLERFSRRYHDAAKSLGIKEAIPLDQIPFHSCRILTTCLAAFSLVWCYDETVVKPF